MNPIHEHCSSQNFLEKFFFIKLNKNKIISNKIRQNFQKIKFSKMKILLIKMICLKLNDFLALLINART